MDNNIQEFTKRVLDAYSHIANPRIQTLISQLIKHLHAFVNETQLTEKEWEYTWDFFARAAQFTHKDRNEFLLLADVLGVSQLIELINHQNTKNNVGSALLGPFYRANAPLRTRGACIASDATNGTRVIINGKVTTAEGKPISNAILDVWQAATNGFYESQDPDQPDMNLRGKFTTDADGSYELVALMPTAYPVPTDGPAGELLTIAKRPALRPAHIHFIVSAKNYETVITQIFSAQDDAIENDVVFTASDNMLGNFTKQNDKYYLTYNFTLTPGMSTYPKAPIK